GLLALRSEETVRRRGEHGEIPCGESIVGGGERLLADTRWLWLRRRVRRRAQVPRNAALSSRPDLDESDPVVHRRARARLAAVILSDAPARRCYSSFTRACRCRAILHAAARGLRRARH